MTHVHPAISRSVGIATMNAGADYLSAKRFRAFASKRVVSSRIFREVGEMYVAELDDRVPCSATTRPLLACLGRPFLTGY